MTDPSAPPEAVLPGQSAVSGYIPRCPFHNSAGRFHKSSFFQCENAVQSTPRRFFQCSVTEYIHQSVLEVPADASKPYGPYKDKMRPLS